MAADENNRRQPHLITLILAAVGALALVAVVLFIGLVVVLASAISGGHTTSASVLKPASGKYVAGIRLHGEVNSDLADEVVDLIEEASRDTDVAGVLLDVNSPGGSVVASQEIYDTVARKRETLPVVAYVREMAASGAYYSIASASKIVANRGSMVGSIGVILSTVETTELMKWAKLKPITMKTGSLKDAGSPVREWTEADKTYLQTLIEDTRKVFASDVVSMRKLTPEAEKRMADGRVVLGAEAVELKLVDVVGSKDDALQAAAGLAGIKEKPELIYIEPKKNFKMFLREMLEEEAIAKELRGLLSKIVSSNETVSIQAR
jgi:protease-4